MPNEQHLSNYADVAVRAGVAIEPGDRLLIHSSLDQLDFTRLLVERAYAAGAVNVDVLWADDTSSRARFTHGANEASEAVTTSSYARLAGFEQGDLMLYVAGRDPDAMTGIDPERIASFEKVNREAVTPLMSAQGRLAHQWSVVAAPTEAWATKVFPDTDAAAAVEQLWEAIFRTCRADSDDPVAAWREHVADLQARYRYLNARNYSGLRYQAPGTDLTLGLPENALWYGGGGATPDGRNFLPNIPTEEVFAGPHRLRGEGVVAATKPLSLFGNLIDGFSFEVHKGRIVEAIAERGQDMLDQLLAIDEGSVRFGEAAMVPMSSAVAREGLVWNNTLFDENDGCHIAIGRAYPISVEGGVDMSPEELVGAGLNLSSTHVDFVVGSPELSVYGQLQGGGEEPIITDGEWGFDL